MYADLEGWLADAGERRFWAALNPGLKIEEPQVGPLFTIDDAERQELWNELLTEGWFHLGPRLPPEQTARMAAAVVTLKRAFIPPVFAYVYDDFWNLGGYLAAFLGALLDPGFRMLPDFWAWCVDPGGAEKGWRPHRDRGFESLLPNGLPRSLSIWVPLTEATPWNGCMYVLPACRDTHYRARTRGTDVANVQDVRALPAEPGSVLGWNQALLHWGGRSSARAAEPRVSFSIEYQRSDSPAFNAPLLDPLAPPAFEQRLALIGKQILQYRHMYDVGTGFEQAALALRARYPLPPAASPLAQ
jgi:hypothetical protein